MKERFPLVRFGPQLWTRDLARKIRTDISALLEKLQAGDELAIDAKGVEVFDYSFANELFGKTILSLASEYAGRFVVIEHLTPYAHENLQKALESLGLQMIERRGTALRLLGKVHPADQATFDALRNTKTPTSAATLATVLGVNLTAMNERLTKLTSMGVIRREKAVSPAGRELYEYRLLS
ncbi:MAG: hypothetical protein EDX89_16665 [Acidobacteria bacterium]|nr:MAG: hypothetical protein EDX89_16665 [Acidobacteriota bacterium]